jgi:tetratricopeptide (TPR) repeat protein
MTKTSRQVYLGLLLVAWAFANPANAQQLGTIAFPTSGASTAQPEFVRGVLYLHSFEYAEAAAAFQRAQALDPRFVMAYWGEALTHTHQVWNQQDLPKARAALAKLGPTAASRLAAAPTARERGYLAAVEALYGEGSKERRDTLYASAMEQLWRENPGDDEVAILYATALFGLTQGVREVAQYMNAGAIAGDVFRRNPQHPGAAHMIIHAFDDPVHAPLGLYAARRYAGIAPGAAHAQHMTTHIFLALGLWSDVIKQNIVAAGPDTSAWMPGHYTSWLVYGYLQNDESEKARALLSSLAAHASSRPRAIGLLGNLGARYVLETERWDSPEARTLAAAGDAKGEDDYSYATFASGFAAARRGERSAAAAALGVLTKANTARAETLRPGATGREVVPMILEYSLRAELLRQDGKRDSAIAFLRKAAVLEDAMPPEFGPPAVVAPTHEALGVLLLESGHASEAAAEYVLALKLAPGRLAAIRGLQRANGARTAREPDGANASR